MNILFLTLCQITDIDEYGIYTDLMRKMRNEGHNVFVATPSERRFKAKTELKNQGEIKILIVRTLNIQKTNIIEKGLGTLLLEYQFHKAINKYLKKIKFDLILYSTPPITLTKIVISVKRRTNAVSYLLLKDIFPQNAVDLEMMRKGGIIFNYFRNREKKLYEISDYIGCMSPANVRYILTNNPKLSPDKVEVCPNSIELSGNKIENDQKRVIRNRYKVPSDATVFIYGGNLGKPQGLDFLLDIIKSNQANRNVFFIIVGSATEFPKVKRCLDGNMITNSILIPEMPKGEYNQLLQSCDVGLILLDRRFTIPNYPSRLLSYLEYKLPVIAATDKATDIGRIAEENGYGLWSLSGDVEKTNQHISILSNDSELRMKMGEMGYKFLKDNYTIGNSYDVIMKHFPRVN